MRCSKSAYNRLKRCYGQLSGVINMIDGQKNCEDVVTQLCAVRSCIDRAIGLMVAENLVNCMNGGDEITAQEKQAKIEKAVNLMMKSR